MAARTEPLSIESLLQKQKAEKEAASKVISSTILSVSEANTSNQQPKFLSKEERAKIAIAKRAQEIREQKEKDDRAKLDREILESQADDLRQKERSQPTRYGGSAGGRSQCINVFMLLVIRDTNTTLDDDRYGHPERDRYDRRSERGGRDSRDRRPPADDRQASRTDYQNVPTGPRAGRGNAPTSAPNGPPSSMPPPESATLPESSTPYVPPMTDNDLSAIRSRYLGVDRKKRKIRKMNDRKFVFDWDAQEDTFAEDSPLALGSNRQGAQVMFGRGRLAGMDDGGGNGPRKATTEFEARLADPMERRKAAKAGLDERHWSDKPLEEMKERDWRIFREDFSISARGWSWLKIYILHLADLKSYRWSHPASSKILDRICNSQDNTKCH